MTQMSSVGPRGGARDYPVTAGVTAAPMACTLIGTVAAAVAPQEPEVARARLTLLPAVVLSTRMTTLTVFDAWPGTVPTASRTLALRRLFAEGPWAVTTEKPGGMG